MFLPPQWKSQHSLCKDDLPLPWFRDQGLVPPAESKEMGSKFRQSVGSRTQQGQVQTTLPPRRGRSECEQPLQDSGRKHAPPVEDTPWGTSPGFPWSHGTQLGLQKAQMQVTQERGGAAAGGSEVRPRPWPACLLRPVSMGKERLGAPERAQEPARPHQAHTLRQKKADKDCERPEDGECSLA